MTRSEKRKKYNLKSIKRVKRLNSSVFDIQDDNINLEQPTEKKNDLKTDEN